MLRAAVLGLSTTYAHQYPRPFPASWGKVRSQWVKSPDQARAVVRRAVYAAARELLDKQSTGSWIGTMSARRRGLNDEPPCSPSRAFHSLSTAASIFKLGVSRGWDAQLVDTKCVGNHRAR